MDAQYAYDLSYMIPRKEQVLPLFPPRHAIQRPFSAAIEIFDDDCSYDDSPIRSVASSSFGTGSASTLSTPDHVTTPDTTGLTAFDFHIDEKDIRGPSGPHLFGASVGSDTQSALEVSGMVKGTPVSATGPFHHRASKFDPFRRDTPVPSHATTSTPQPYYVPTAVRVPAFHRLSTADWSPQEVVQWMQSLGFEDDIVNKFYQNDITGSILLELQSEDLKELDILSFGKRHRVMGSIQSLRGSAAASSTAPSSSRSSSVTADVPSTARTSTMMSNHSYKSSKSYQSSNDHQSCSTTDDDSVSFEKPRRRQHSAPGIRKTSDVHPGDSVSIVAIEQVLPRPHHCSKGEDCRKWQKQQAKIARLAQDLPIASFGGRAIVSGDPGNPHTAPNLLKSPTKSEIPSIVASSDAMGPGRVGSLQISQDRLKDVQPRDPQENVRNYLNFQSLNRLQTVDNPATPPQECLLSPSPDSAKVTPTLAENLSHLPKLRIPSMHGSEASMMTDNIWTQKTVTPSVLTRRKHLYAGDMTAIPGREVSNFKVSAASPADFYRTDPCYRQETPFSETDAPVTAVPIGPVAREDSQSVPPNMRFGNIGLIPLEPIVRSSSTVGHRTYPSTSNLNTLREARMLSPIETPDDLRRTPRAPHCRSNNIFDPENYGKEGITHSGWMKKRKTTRLLRHDWDDHHFTLKGTQLAMHNDEEASKRNSKALEYIDIDDYAVACSSFASNSKLTAAFKKTILKRRDSAPANSAFAFSLIPAPNNNGGMIDRKTMFLNSGKSHHFAVKNRDERIDWMRELMLAKAVKRGRETGAAMNINGNLI
ncbi:Sterile alpha motiftype 2 [Penicillium lividum]|nr:Sterile alpha motiftype 2 [Penicillium lividum]